MNRSPERNTFQLKNYLERCEADGKEPRADYIEIYRQADYRDMENDANAQWKKNNLEYDLRSTKWICDKAKAREEYAQNIYAALCNQDWQRNDVWPLLKGETYSCSWHYAGGIVADMREEGDYIDWYCSGIRGGASEDELAAMDPDQRVKYQWMQDHFVGEGKVTDEVREDFFKLGWIPVQDQSQDT
jgi:hypothetical protein